MGRDKRELDLRRFEAGPIIAPQAGAGVGTNINGPSLVATPAWLPQRLGKYYLYFAAHRDDTIRLAWADDLAGPWQVHGPGALHISQTAATDHIASPDVHVDHHDRRIHMYFHGGGQPGANQATFAATSADGVSFLAGSERLGGAYWRVFEYDAWHYALEMPGRMYRSRAALGPFEPGPVLFPPRMRHSAVLVRGDRLFVFWTRRGDSPERILLSSIDLRPAWTAWRASRPLLALSPEREWEGGLLPLKRSRGGASPGPERALRDPAVFEDAGRVYLLYAVAGESGIAIAEVCSLPGSRAVGRAWPLQSLLRRFR